MPSRFATGRTSEKLEEPKHRKAAHVLLGPERAVGSHGLGRWRGPQR